MTFKTSMALFEFCAFVRFLVINNRICSLFASSPYAQLHSEMSSARLLWCILARLHNFHRKFLPRVNNFKQGYFETIIRPCTILVSW